MSCHAMLITVHKRIASCYDMLENTCYDMLRNTCYDMFKTLKKTYFAQLITVHKRIASCYNRLKKHVKKDML